MAAGRASGDDALLERCRGLFGDERADYQAAIDRHYAQGAPVGWELSYLTNYATMHPYEDFAETWAHYLHICDTVQTASQYGLTAVAGIDAFSQFRDLVTGVWVPMSTALNMINRSMGKDDLYPFVIPAPVLDKLDFVARCVTSQRRPPPRSQRATGRHRRCTTARWRVMRHPSVRCSRPPDPPSDSEHAPGRVARRTR